MTVGDLITIFLRLQMADKDSGSEFAFASSKDDSCPFGITGIRIDDEGDLCLECDERAHEILSAKDLAEAVSAYDRDKTVYFLSIDKNGETELYNIKDGGTKDRHDPEIRMISAGVLLETLKTVDHECLFHLESGTINFTINSVYLDEDECLVVESNEIEELDDYPLSMIMEELSGVSPDTKVLFYDDEAKEYYGIYCEEMRIGPEGDVWIKAR